MRATGVVRRIDDLGRIVIPKEIRRTMRMREGDPLEIFVEGNGEIVLKKYSVMEGLAEVSASYAETLSKSSGMICAVCDTDGLVCATGQLRRRERGSAVTREIEEIISRRTPYFRRFTGEKPIYPFEGCPIPAVGVVPIVANGDCAGVIALLSEEGAPLSEGNKKLLSLTAGLLSANFEE